MSDDLAQWIEESNRLGAMFNDLLQIIRENHRNPNEIQSVRAWIEEARQVAESRYNSRLRSLAAATSETANVILRDSGEPVTHSMVEEHFNNNLTLLKKYSEYVDGVEERKAARARIHPQVRANGSRFIELVGEIEANLNDQTNFDFIRDMIAECKEAGKNWRDAALAYVENRGILKWRNLKGYRVEQATQTDVLNEYDERIEQLQNLEKRFAIAVGHARARHGNQNIFDLDKRLQVEGKLEASSFSKDEHLENFTLQALDYFQRDIDDWLISGKSKLELEYENEEIQATLLSKKPNGNPLEFPTKLRLVLTRDTGLPTGYQVKTAYITR